MAILTEVLVTLAYPDETGRNIPEILRVIDALQLTANHRVATPADWQQGQDCIVPPRIRCRGGQTIPQGLAHAKTVSALHTATHQSEQGTLGKGRFYPNCREHEGKWPGVGLETRNLPWAQGVGPRVRRRNHGIARGETRGGGVGGRHREEPGCGREQEVSGARHYELQVPGRRCVQSILVAFEISANKVAVTGWRLV